MPCFFLSLRSRTAFLIGYPALLISLMGCGGGEESSATATTPDASATGGAAAPGATAAPGMPGPPGMMPGMMPPTDMAAGSSAAGSAPAAAPGMPAGYIGQPADPSAMAAGAGAGYSGAPGYAGAPGTGGGIPQAPPLPANVSEWTEQNYLEALQAKDERLLEAIDSKVKSAPGDPKVAQFLTNMLTAMMTVNAPNSTANGVPGASYPGAAGTSTLPGGYVPPGGSAMPPGAMPPGAMPPGAMPPGAMPRGSSAISPGGSAMPPGSAAPGTTLPPQSSLGHPRPNLAFDSLAIMLAESSTAYLQAPAVGAIAGKDIAGAAGAAGAAVPAGAQMMPPGARPAGSPAMPGYAAGQSLGTTPQDGGYQGAGVNPAGGLDTKKLVERIIDGLIQNGSSEAWQALYGITTQTVKTPLPPSEATELVVRGLYRHIDKNPAMIEPVLLSFVDGTAQIPPESRAAALRVTADTAAAAADRLTGFDPPPAFRGTGASNNGMGMGMMTGATMPGASMPGTSMPGDSSQGRAGAGAVAASAAYPGMTGIGAAGGGAGTNVTSTEPAESEAALIQAARFLWSPGFVSALVKQLNASADLGYGLVPVSGGDFVRVAASIPNAQVRQAVGELFEKCHATGVANLNSAGFFATEVHDPGMLVTLKSLPRPKTSRAASQQAPTPDTWTAASQDLVLSLRDRMRALSAKPGKLTPVTDSFPVRLHKNAVAEFSGMLTLPGTFGASLKESSPSPINVYYARTSFTPQRPKDQEDLADHYESRTSGQRRADQALGILWMDGVKTAASGTKRSLDVIIQAATGNAQGAAGGGEFGGAAAFSGGAGAGNSGSFTIEILVIDSPEPKQSAAAGEPTTDK